MVLFILLSGIAGLAAGFDVNTLTQAIGKGVNSTVANAILFLFSVLFFAIVTEVGVFQPIIKVDYFNHYGNVRGRFGQTIPSSFLSNDQ